MPVRSKRLGDPFQSDSYNVFVNSEGEHGPCSLGGEEVVDEEEDEEEEERVVRRGAEEVRTDWTRVRGFW
jgi:hypothetical protein